MQAPIPWFGLHTISTIVCKRNCECIGIQATKMYKQERGFKLKLEGSDCEKGSRIQENERGKEKGNGYESEIESE